MCFPLKSLYYARLPKFANERFATAKLDWSTTCGLTRKQNGTGRCRSKSYMTFLGIEGKIEIEIVLVIVIAIQIVMIIKIVVTLNPEPVIITIVGELFGRRAFWTT